MNFPKGRPKVSICIATFRKCKILDRVLREIHEKNKLCPFPYEVIVCDDCPNGSSFDVCKKHEARYIWNETSSLTKNPAKPRFLASRMALGEVVINMSDDVLFKSENIIEAFYEKVKEKVAVFATVLNVNPITEEYIEDYTSTNRQKPYFFCGAIFRKHLEEIGHQDLNYIFPAYDDDSLAKKLSRIGVDFVFDQDIICHHLNHPKNEMADGSDSSVWFYNHYWQEKSTIFSG